MSVALSEITDRGRFEAIRDDWNALVESSHPEPFYRHEYISAFLSNFLRDSAFTVVTGRGGQGKLTLALPLVTCSGSICGLRVLELASPTNVHSLRFDLVAENAHDGDEAADASARALLEHLDADKTWTVLKITDVPPDGQAWRIYRAAEAAGFPVGAWEAQRSPYLTLSPGGERPQGLRAKFRANLRRRRKRLEEKGEVRVERLQGDSLTARDLEACLAMETTGWKGRQGSAVVQSPAAHGFHLELLSCKAHKDLASLYVLKLGGRPIAFQYGLTSQGVFSLVMTSYDESFAEFGPGHLLTEEVLRDCTARGLREFDFLGCDLPWKMEWTSTVRPHHWLFIFRKSAYGRFLRQIKFGWAVAARRWLAACRSGLSFGRMPARNST